MNNTRIYYLYRHVRKDKNTPFYIGIGTKPLIYNTRKQEYSRAYSKQKRNTHWTNIVNKTDYIIEILYESSSQEEIINKEIEFINLYYDILCNKTSGGFGITSYNHTNKSKQLISLFSKTRVRKKGYNIKHSKEGLENIRKAQTNKIMSEETKRKIGNYMKGNNRGVGHKVSKNHIEIIKKTHSKPLIAFNNNEVLKFKSNKEACEYFNITNSGGILRCIKGITKTYKNLKWKYDKEDNI